MMTFTSMSKHMLFAYVDGADLHEIAESLENAWTPLLGKATGGSLLHS